MMINKFLSGQGRILAHNRFFLTGIGAGSSLPPSAYLPQFFMHITRASHLLARLVRCAPYQLVALVGRATFPPHPPLCPSRNYKDIKLWK